MTLRGCWNCGADYLDQEAAFCTKCGERFDPALDKPGTHNSFAILTSIVCTLIILGTSFLLLLVSAANQTGQPVIWRSVTVAAFAVLPTGYGLSVLFSKHESRQNTLIRNDRAVLLGAVPTVAAIILAFLI